MSKAIREAYGEALVAYGAPNPDVVVLTADLASSTKVGGFEKAAPERYFNVGIAEYNMVGMAAGLASTGKIPFVNTFAVFLTPIPSVATRALIAYTNLNVKLMGAYGGLSDAYDGPSHHAIEDIALVRSFPNFSVLVASDEYVTDWMVKHAIDTPGPMYIRLSRGAMPTLYNKDTKFEAGKGMLLRDGTDVTIFGCGLMSGVALEAAKQLEAEGISAQVVDLFSIKPIDRDIIRACAAKTGAVVTAEEHSIIGGLGSAVAEVLTTEGCKVPQRMVGVQDCFTTTGKYELILAHFGLDAKNIVRAAKESIAMK